MPIIIWRENGVEKWLGPTPIVGSEPGRPIRGVGLFETCPFQRHGEIVVGVTDTGPQCTYWHGQSFWHSIPAPLDIKVAFERCLYPVFCILADSKSKLVGESLDFVISDGKSSYFDYDPVFKKFEEGYYVLGPGKECQPYKNYIQTLNISPNEMTEEIAIKTLIETSKNLTDASFSYPLFLYIPEKDELTLIEEGGARHQEPLPREEDIYGI